MSRTTEENITIRGYAPSLPLDEVTANVIIDGNELGTTLFISGAQLNAMSCDVSGSDIVPNCAAHHIRAVGA